MRQRPEVLNGDTYKMRTGCGSIYITVNDSDGRPFEVFIRMGKAGGCGAAQCESTGRLISSFMRTIPEDFATEDMVRHIHKQLAGVICHVGTDPGLPRSCSDAVARVLEKRYLKTGKEAPCSA